MFIIMTIYTLAIKTQTDIFCKNKSTNLHTGPERLSVEFTDAVRADCFEMRRKFSPQCQVQGVALVGPVERERNDGGIALEQDQLAHR